MTRFLFYGVVCYTSVPSSLPSHNSNAEREWRELVKLNQTPNRSAELPWTLRIPGSYVLALQTLKEDMGWVGLGWVGLQICMYVDRRERYNTPQVEYCFTLSQLQEGSKRKTVLLIENSLIH